MVKVTVCDYCKSEGKLVEATRVTRLTGKGMKMDICHDHAKSVPKNTIEFVKQVYKFSGIELNDEQAKSMLGR